MYSVPWVAIARFERRIQVAAEGVAQRRKAGGMLVVADDEREARRVLQAAQREEVVPVGVHRMREQPSWLIDSGRRP